MASGSGESPLHSSYLLVFPEFLFRTIAFNFKGSAGSAEVTGSPVRTG